MVHTKAQADHRKTATVIGGAPWHQPESEA